MSDSPYKPMLTPDFLQRSPDRVIFHPASIDEAEYVAQQLLNAGFRYYSADYPNQLQNAVVGCIYLDNDKTIMVSAGKQTGTLVSSDQFTSTGFSLPLQPMAEDVQKGSFALFPRSVAEGRAMLLALKQAGAALPEGNAGIFPLAAQSVYQGMLVQDGQISIALNRGALQGAKILTPADLGIGPASPLSPEQSAMHAAFNEMAARMEKMAAQLARLENEILPKTLEKTGTKMPGLKKP